VTEAASPRRHEYVGFWKRVAASLIDTLILLIVIVPLLLAVYGTGYLARAQESGLAGFWDFVIQVVLPAVAVILFWKYRGATPGKDRRPALGRVAKLRLFAAVFIKHLLTPAASRRSANPSVLSIP